MSDDTRSARVRALLSELGYKGCWAYRSKGPTFTMQAFIGPAGVLLVQEWPEDAGVEVYAPVVTNNSMQDLLDEIRRRSTT